MSARRKPDPGRDTRGTYACLAGGCPGCMFVPPGRRHPSVTTVLGAVLSKPALIQWAANCAADEARDWVRAQNNPDCDGEDCGCPRICGAWSAGDADKLRDSWAQAHTRQRDKAAARGSTVHRIVQALAERRDPAPSDLTPEVLPYLESLRAFVADHPPRVLRSECVVSSRHGYAGTLDAIHRVPWLDDRRPFRRVIRDWKTRRDEAHARLYGEEVLQLAAYRYATWMRDAGGTVRPMPRVDAAEVVLLWPGGYRIERVEANREAHAMFLRCFAIYQWQRRTRDKGE